MKISKWFAVLLVVLCVGLMTNVALAKTGGVKVDVNQDCTDGTQTNVLSCGTTAYIAINVSGNNFPGVGSCQICSNGTSGTNCTALTCTFVSQCSFAGVTYNYYSFTVSGSGSTTVVVNDADGKNIGADTFRVTCD
jgi:hypothetical protein